MIREEREHRRERIRGSGRDRNRRAGARWGGSAPRREPELAQWRRWGEGRAGAAQEGRAPPVPRCPGRRPASSACRVPGNRARLPGGGGARGEVTLHQVPGRSRPGGQRCGVRVREDGEPWRGRKSGQGAGRGEGGKAAAAALPEPWKHSSEGRPRPSFWDPRVPAEALLGVASLAFRPRRRVNRSPTASSNPRAQCLPKAVRLSPQNARVWTEPAWSGRVRSDMGRRAATCAHPLLP